MFRSVFAVVVGFVTIAILFVASDVLLGAILHAGRQVFTIVNMAVALPYAAVAGYVAARIARGRETATTIGLCVFAAVVNVLVLAADPGHQPLWYSCAMLALIVIGALVGGRLRKRQILTAA